MTTSNSNLKKFGIPAALLAGGIALGSAFAPIGLATAQTDESDGSAPDGTATDGSHHERDGRFGRHGHRPGAFRSDAVLDLLGLEREELKAAFEEGQTLAEVAEAQGVSEEVLVDALVDAATERIEDAAADGRIDQAEADERIAGLEELVTERINTEPGDRDHHRHGRPGRGALRGVLAELGLDTETLREGLVGGQTLAEVAAENGVTEEELVAALVAEAEERLAAAVEADKLTQEEADERAADLPERITEKVNSEPGSRFGGSRGRG